MRVETEQTWKTQLEKGQRAELQIADYYARYGFKPFIAHGHCPDGDIVLWNGGKYRLLEVKDCPNAIKYGSFAVEFSSAGRPSGLETTKADDWIFVVDCTAYSIPTLKLRELVRSGEYKTRETCGGKNKCWLIPIIDIELRSELLILAPYVA
jgi:hypothetical protein